MAWQERLLPPQCSTMDDWVTMISVFLAGVALITLCILMIFNNQNVGTMLALFGMIASFVSGRVSVIISPTKSDRS